MDRPVFRVGVAGLDPRDARLIEIVFQHGQHNRHDFRLLDVLDMTRLDILIANASDPEGLDGLAAARSYARHIPTVIAVPRGAQTSARHSVTIDRLTLQLLPILNRVVQEEGLRGQPELPEALCDELTEIHALPEAAVEAAAGATAVAVTVAVGADAASATATAPDRGPAAGTGRPIPQPIVERGWRTAAPAACGASAGADTPPGAGPSPGAGTPSDAGILPGTDAMPGAVMSVLGCTPGGHIVSPTRVSPTCASPAALGSMALSPAAPGPTAPGPAAPGPAAPDPVGTDGIAARPGAPLLRLQVLVADPSLAVQAQLVGELQRLGLEAHAVVSGAAAARCLASRHFDLIVIESGLADTDGFTLVHWLRRSPAYRRTPVILLCSRIGWLDPARARLDGHLTLLEKPVTRAALGRLVQRALRHALVVDDFAAFAD